MSTNPFVERAANVLAAHMQECHEAPDPYRAMAHRLEEQRLLAAPVQTVWSAHPVKVRRQGLGVELDVTALAGALVRELAMQFREDPESVGELLVNIAGLSDAVTAQHTLDGRGAAEYERDERVAELLDDLGGATQQLASSEARDLARQLEHEAAPGPVSFPHQQDHRSAA